MGERLWHVEAIDLTNGLAHVRGCLAPCLVTNLIDARGDDILPGGDVSEAAAAVVQLPDDQGWLSVDLSDYEFTTRPRLN